jgi:3-phenylpropionate/trans-cinnamate dioxygenase ferredoxin subunit
MSSSSPTFQRLVPAADIPPGKMRCFDVDGTQVVVCHTREGFFAVDNICTHAYAHMDEGRLRGFRLICPLHGASFDVRTGAVLGAPANQPLRSYPVRIEDEHVEVAVE